MKSGGTVSSPKTGKSIFRHTSDAFNNLIEYIGINFTVSRITAN